MPFSPIIIPHYLFQQEANISASRIDFLPFLTVVFKFPEYITFHTLYLYVILFCGGWGVAWEEKTVWKDEKQDNSFGIWCKSQYNHVFFFFFSLITSSTNFCDYLLVKFFFFFFFFFQPLLPISAQMIKFALELIQCGFIKQTAREKNNNNNNNTLSFFFLFFLSLFFSFNHATALSRKWV